MLIKNLEVRSVFIHQITSLWFTVITSVRTSTGLIKFESIQKEDQFHLEQFFCQFLQYQLLPANRKLTSSTNIWPKMDRWWGGATPNSTRGKRRRKKKRRSVYFFLLNRLKRFSLSFSRLPGLDSAATEATEAGSVWARAAGAGVLWLLGVTSNLSPDMAAEMAAIHVFISSWRAKRRKDGGGGVSVCVFFMCTNICQ